MVMLLWSNVKRLTNLLPFLTLLKKKKGSRGTPPKKVPDPMMEKLKMGWPPPTHPPQKSNLDFLGHPFISRVQKGVHFDQLDEGHPMVVSLHDSDRVLGNIAHTLSICLLMQGESGPKERGRRGPLDLCLPCINHPCCHPCLLA